MSEVQLNRLPSSHRDLLRRLAIAESPLESLTVVGRAAAFDAYSVARI